MRTSRILGRFAARPEPHHTILRGSAHVGAGTLLKSAARLVVHLYPPGQPVKGDDCPVDVQTTLKHIKARACFEAPNLRLQ